MKMMFGAVLCTKSGRGFKVGDVYARTGSKNGSYIVYETAAGNVELYRVGDVISYSNGKIAEWVVLGAGEDNENDWPHFTPIRCHLDPEEKFTEAVDDYYG